MLALAADPGSDRAGAESATRIDEAEADPQVSSPAEHWRRLFRIDLATGATERVGPDGVNVWEFDWRGGDVAAIVSDDPSESGWYASRVVLIDLATNAVAEIHQPRYQLERVRLAPDGRTVAVVEGFCSDRAILAGETTVAAQGEPARVLAPELDVTCLEWDGEGSLWFAAQRGTGAAAGKLALDGVGPGVVGGPGIAEHRLGADRGGVTRRLRAGGGALVLGRAAGAARARRRRPGHGLAGHLGPQPRRRREAPPRVPAGHLDVVRRHRDRRAADHPGRRQPARCR